MSLCRSEWDLSERNGDPLPLRSRIGWVGDGRSRGRSPTASDGAPLARGNAKRSCRRCTAKPVTGVPSASLLHARAAQWLDQGPLRRFVMADVNSSAEACANNVPRIAVRAGAAAHPRKRCVRTRVCRAANTRTVQRPASPKQGPPTQRTARTSSSRRSRRQQ